MPKFFVPHAKDADQAESLWKSTKLFNEEQSSRLISDRRIHGLSYSHDGTKYHDDIGKKHALLGEEVLVILDAGDLFMVCTENRGVVRGGPFLVGKHWDTRETEFEAD